MISWSIWIKIWYWHNSCASEQQAQKHYICIKKWQNKQKVAFSWLLYLLLAASWQTLSQCWKDNLAHPILITVYYCLSLCITLILTWRSLAASCGCVPKPSQLFHDVWLINFQFLYNILTHTVLLSSMAKWIIMKLHH